MLIGKAKTQFEKWYLLNEVSEDLLIWEFYTINPSMQWGVYVDFFDEENIDISINLKLMYGYRITQVFGCVYEETTNTFNTRHQAREEAIKKANLIYNKL